MNKFKRFLVMIRQKRVLCLAPCMHCKHESLLYLIDESHGLLLSFMNLDKTELAIFDACDGGYS